MYLVLIWHCFTAAFGWHELFNGYCPECCGFLQYPMDLHPVALHSVCTVIWPQSSKCPTTCECPCHCVGMCTVLTYMHFSCSDFAGDNVLWMIPNIFMVALCNRADHYIFALWFLSSSFFLSLPNLSHRRLDVCHASTHGVALVRIQDAGLKPAARSSLKTQGRKKVAKNRHLGTIAQLCRAISSQLTHVSTIGKKLVKQQYVLHMSSQYELRPTSGWDLLASLRHPCKF